MIKKLYGGTIIISSIIVGGMVAVFLFELLRTKPEVFRYFCLLPIVAYSLVILPIVGLELWHKYYDTESDK